jgi:hypothetical protein
MFDTVAYVIENKHLAEENAKLAARNAELEQMVAVLMRHEARDDTIKVQRARIAELEAALKPLALQNLSTEVQMVTAVYLTPIGELDRQAREIKRRDDEIRAARAALEKKE